MRIGILGAGNIAGALGQRWAANGHDVFFGVRDPQSYTVQLVLNGCGPNAQAGTMREAATYGDVVVLAVPWSAVPDVRIRSWWTAPTAWGRPRPVPRHRGPSRWQS